MLIEQNTINKRINISFTNY